MGWQRTKDELLRLLKMPLIKSRLRLRPIRFHRESRLNQERGREEEAYHFSAYFPDIGYLPSPMTIYSFIFGLIIRSTLRLGAGQWTSTQSRADFPAPISSRGSRFERKLPPAVFVRE